MTRTTVVWAFFPTELPVCSFSKLRQKFVATPSITFGDDKKMQITAAQHAVLAVGPLASSWEEARPATASAAAVLVSPYLEARLLVGTSIRLPLGAATCVIRSVLKAHIRSCLRLSAQRKTI